MYMYPVWLELWWPAQAARAASLLHRSSCSSFLCQLQLHSHMDHGRDPDIELTASASAVPSPSLLSLATSSSGTTPSPKALAAAGFLATAVAAPAAAEPAAASDMPAVTEDAGTWVAEEQGEPVQRCATASEVRQMHAEMYEEAVAEQNWEWARRCRQRMVEIDHPEYGPPHLWTYDRMRWRRIVGPLTQHLLEVQCTWCGGPFNRSSDVWGNGPLGNTNQPRSPQRASEQISYLAHPHSGGQQQILCSVCSYVLITLPSVLRGADLGPETRPAILETLMDLGSHLAMEQHLADDEESRINEEERLRERPEDGAQGERRPG